jgi:acetoacetyl-CoA synthetase
MDSLALPRKLWEHPDPQSTRMWKFMQSINRKHNLQLRVRPYVLD